MINWEKIERTLEDWYTSAIDLSVQWVGKDATNKSRPYGELSILSLTSQGTDENREEYDSGQPTGLEIIRTTYGLRQFTLACKVVSRSHRPSQSAWCYLEKAQSSLSDPSTIELFAAANLAMVRPMGTTVSFQPFQNRNENVGVLDIQFGTISTKTDPREKGGYVDKILVTSDVDEWANDLDDEEIPVP